MKRKNIHNTLATPCQHAEKIMHALPSEKFPDGWFMVGCKHRQKVIAAVNWKGFIDYEAEICGHCESYMPMGVR